MPSSSSSSSSSVHPVPTLLSVSFGGGYDLINDLVIPLPLPIEPFLNILDAPHLEQTATGELVRAYPYLYKGNTLVTITSAVWVFSDDLPAGTNIYAMATCNIEGITFTPKLAVISADRKTVTVTDFIATTGLISHVACLDPMTLDYTLSLTGIGGAYLAAGTSSNRIYICLPTGNPEAVNLFQTTVHLACYFGGALNADQAVINTFSGMSGLSVKSWNWDTDAFDIPLYYYKRTTPTPPWETTYLHNGQDSVTNLLSNSWKSGQCTCWAALMLDALIVNGIVVRLDEGPGLVVTKAFPNAGYSHFVVKYFDYWAAGGPTYWYMLFSGIASSGEMMPPPSPVTLPNGYGELTNKPGLLGQGTSLGSSPSQKAFGWHQFLRYTDAANVTKWYDQSYGQIYVSEINF